MITASMLILIKIPTSPKIYYDKLLEYLKENDCPVPNDDEWKLSRNGLESGSYSLDDSLY